MMATGDESYSCEYRVEQRSEGKNEFWDVIDADRADGGPVATCNSAEDALLVANALNAATAKTRLSVHD
jgi:hypothetical protein